MGQQSACYRHLTHVTTKAGLSLAARLHAALSAGQDGGATTALDELVDYIQAFTRKTVVTR
jgi:hypothetical protein